MRKIADQGSESDAGTWLQFADLAVTRLVLSVLCGVGVYFGFSPWGDDWVGGLCAMLSASIVFNVIALGTILLSNPLDSKRRAKARDLHTVVIILMDAVVCIFAMVAAWKLSDEDIRGCGTIWLCLWSVFNFWVLIHLSFTLRYAHLYYGPPIGGLNFPRAENSAEPYDATDRDFLYFAMGIGMCYQVSDISVTAPNVRNLTLAHALISFFYNGAFLTFVFNIVLQALATNRPH